MKFDLSKEHNRVSYYRARKGMTQAELARKINCNRNTINNVENGNHLPSLKISYKLATVLDTDIVELFNLDNKI